MQITSIDNVKDQNVSIITSMEAKDYPIYTTMYHPEYQLLYTHFTPLARKDT